ncbi:MAG TPA: hypothetical protein VHT91_07535 [Kofleriaceae bacterium]|jgi:hypothetical protein|nr:hypothetical protein [Kofleriaceae bacterium]
MRWIVSLSIVLGCAVTACGGPQIPVHNGYKPKEATPWKKPKPLKFDDKGEAKAEGDLSYPDMRRARWFELNLPSSGQLTVAVEVTPPGDAVNEEFDLGMEVLDPGYRVISKSDLEDEDAQQLTKKKTLVELAPGKYLVHLFLQGRMDTADFVLRAAFKPTAAAEVKSNFPAEVPFVPVLAQVPLQDDTPRSYKPVVVEKHGARHVRTAPPPPPTATVSARIINVQIVAGGTQITLGRGTTTGASDGMHGSIRGVPGGFQIGGCNERTCTATIKATPDQIKASDNTVTLTP